VKLFHCPYGGETAGVLKIDGGDHRCLMHRIIDIAAKLVLLYGLSVISIVFPSRIRAQSSSTSINNCEPRPSRVDNAYTRNPYDDISYYNCQSVEDVYRLDQREIQSRTVCDYTKVIYYDRDYRKWTNISKDLRCRTKYYSQSLDAKPIIPEGWHPPLIIR